MMKPLYISVYDYETALDVVRTHPQVTGIILRQSLLSTSDELDEIKHLVQEVQNADVQLYLKDNRLLHNSHLKTVITTLKYLNGNKVGIFVGDPAVIKIAKEIAYDGEIVFAPEMVITSHGNAQFWVQQGARNVEISHELTFKELNVIMKNLSIIPFVQIHGQLSMFQSRRLLVDNYFTHLDHKISVAEHGQLSLYDKERELNYIITQDERGTEIYNGQIISIVDLLHRFEKMPNCIVDTYFSTKQKRNAVISLYLEALSDQEYETHKDAYAEKMKEIYVDEQLSRGFFLKPTIF